MNFKVGDWIKYINGKSKTTAQVIQVGRIENYIGVSTGENVHIEDCELWQPKEGEWCWYGYEIVEVIDSYNLEYIKITRQNSNSYEEVKFVQLEPFIGTLPSFLKKD